MGTTSAIEIRSVSGHRRPRGKATVIGLVLVLVIVGTLLVLRRPLEPLSRDVLEAARRTWAAAGIDDYDMKYVMANGEYFVSVRQGHVVTLTRDGERTTTHRTQDYSVDGLFDILELELEGLNSPGNPFGADPATILQRVQFHSKLGYVEHYLRAVGGTGRSYGIEVIEFTPQ